MARVDPSLALEQSAAERGIRFLIGLDEVGRGAVAGPIAVGAALLALPVNDFPVGLRDSKQLTLLARQKMVSKLGDWLLDSAVGYADSVEIDEQGITHAQNLAAARALKQIFQKAQLTSDSFGVMFDGHYDWLRSERTVSLLGECSVLFRPKLDRDSALVAAASVVAKVDRDALMTKLSLEHPEYAWQSNKGYGSAAHRMAIEHHGVTAWHRKTWLTAWMQ